MNGFLKFKSFEEREINIAKLLGVDPALDAHIVRSASLPHVLLRDIDLKTKEMIVTVAGGTWVADMNFEPFLD